jgi:hypothetical protein
MSAIAHNSHSVTLSILVANIFSASIVAYSQYSFQKLTEKSKISQANACKADFKSILITLPKYNMLSTILSLAIESVKTSNLPNTVLIRLPFRTPDALRSDSGKRQQKD